MKYNYDPETGRCVCADGTVYTIEEMLFIARHDFHPDDIKAIHAVKKIFDGELDTSEPEKYDWLSKMGKRLKNA